MAEYWFDKSSARTEIASIKTKYNNVVKAAMNVAKVMKNYVCVDNKWYDENAVMVATWWNQSSATTAGGNIKFNKTTKELEFTKDASASDGEDRIKYLVQVSARMYWVAVCGTLSGLETSHKTVKTMAPFKACVTAAKNATYKGYGTNVTGTKWSTMMENNFSSNKWTKTTLPTTSSDGKKTSTSQVKSFITDINSKLKALDTAKDAYFKELNNLATNNNKSRWWGFSSAEVTNIVSAIKKYDDEVEQRLENFTQNLYTALQGIDDMTIADINRLNTDFN